VRGTGAGVEVPRRDLAGAAALVLLGVLAAELALRVGFPCDLLSWPESVFLTAMARLQAGLGLFGEPSDVNSWVRGPALEYLAFGLLRPLGLALDVRAGRALAIGLQTLGVAAVVHAAIPRDAPRGVRATTFAVGMLAAFSAATADAPYEPALLIAFAGLVTLGCTVAVRDGRTDVGLATTAFAGLGVLVMQEATLAAAGAWLALVLGRRVRWPVAVAALALGAATTAGAIALLHEDPWTAFWLFELPSGADRLQRAATTLGWFVGPGILVAACAAPACLAWLARRDPPGRAFAVAWAGVGACVVLPLLLPWVPSNTDEGAARVVALWLVVPVWVACALPGAAPAAWGWDAAVRACVRGALLLLLFPSLLPPAPPTDAACDALTAALRADLAAGRHVVVAHGVAPLVQAGVVPIFLDVPAEALDRGGAGRYLARMRAELDGTVFDRAYQLLGVSLVRALAVGKGFRRIVTIRARPAVLGEEVFGAELTGGFDDPPAPVVRRRIEIMERNP